MAICKVPAWDTHRFRFLAASVIGLIFPFSSTTMSSPSSSSAAGGLPRPPVLPLLAESHLVLGVQIHQVVFNMRGGGNGGGERRLMEARREGHKKGMSQPARYAIRQSSGGPPLVIFVLALSRSEKKETWVRSSSKPSSASYLRKGSSPR